MTRKFSKSLRTIGLLLMCVLSIPGFAITSTPSVITFDDGTGSHRIYAFARGDSGTLVVNFWSSGQWWWADLGLPPDAATIFSPSAITWLADDGQQRIAVFASSDSGHLVVCHWDGGTWIWDDLSANPGVVFGYDYPDSGWQTNAITYIDDFGNRQIRVYSVDGQSNPWFSSCFGTCENTTGNWQNLWQFYPVSCSPDCSSPGFKQAGGHPVGWPTALHFTDSEGNGRTVVVGERPR